MDKQMILLLGVMAITFVYTTGRETKRNKKLCIQVITVVLACFSGLRSWWMGDLIKYYTLYTECNGVGWRDRVFENYTNIGIRLLFRGAGFFGMSFEICIFIIAAFIAITLGVLIYKYSPSPYWSYLMFIAMGFYIFTFSGLKQTCAMGFVMLAMIEILNNRPGKFLIWTFIAGAFHAPAFIFLAAYPVAKKKMDGMYIAIMALVIGAVYLFRGQIVELLAEAYYEGEKFYAASGTIGGRALMMIFIMAFGLFMRPLRRDDVTYRQVFNLMVVAVIIQYFSMYDNVFSRLSDYYYQFIVLFMPLIMEEGEHQALVQPERKNTIRYFTHNSYVLIGIIITLFALWYYSSYIGSSQTILQDFRFLWQIDPYSLYGQ